MERDQKTPLIDMKGLSKSFARRALLARRSFSLQGIDITVNRGEVVGLLGESGSGKSTTAGIMTLLTPFDAGTYLFKGQDVTTFDRAQRFAFKSQVQIVFQDPYGSLNPRANVREIVGEGLLLHQRGLDAAAREVRSRALMDEVGLPATALDRYPRAFSGGQRQRIAIARALAVGPEVLICDEPLSSLDVSIQAQILELFARLIRDHNLTMVLITHDIHVARLLCDRVYVMHDGQIVEQGPAATVLTEPGQDYTRRLLAAAY
jgi:ABC-type microcin C transport system duplicated ATPase subunit YejF